MYDLMIMARPEQPFYFMITQETEEYDALSVDQKTGFMPLMIDIISDIINEYDIQSISLYGPHSYIASLKPKIEAKFDFDVYLADAGKEDE